MGSLGPFEIIIIAVVLLLFFGAKRLPELARGIGKSLKEFKKATRDIQDEIDSATDSSSDKYINHDNTGYDHVDQEKKDESKQDQEAGKKENQ